MALGNKGVAERGEEGEFRGVLIIQEIEGGKGICYTHLITNLEK